MFSKLLVILFVLLSVIGSFADEATGTFEFCFRELRSPRELAEARSRAVVLDSLLVVFDLADIESYEVPEHDIRIKGSAIERLRRWEGTNSGYVPGEFYIRVNGEVIYQGRTHSILVSYIPPHPEPFVVTPFLFSKNNEIIRIGLYQPVEFDPRNDPRILRVLRETGVLRK